MAIPEKIKEIAKDIRTKIYGEQVRESLAKGLEISGETSNESNERSKDAKETSIAIQEKYIEQILAQDLNPNKDPELVDIRNGNETAGERILKFEQETNHQLAQNGEQVNVLQKNKQGVSIDEYPRLAPEITDSPRIKRAIDSVSGGYIDFPKTHPFIINEPIDLTRGHILRGLGSLDTVFGNSGHIILADHANCEMIITERESGGPSTHYLCIENLVLDGNAQNQDEAHTAVKYHGAWVGSWIRNVLIRNVRGPGLSIDNHADIQLDHVWIIGCYTDDYGLQINKSYTSGQQGYINIDHLYVENIVKEEFVGQNATTLARNTPSARGKGILINRTVTTIIHELHMEGCLYGVDLSGNHTVQIENLSSSHMGRDDVQDSSFIHILDENNSVISLGTGNKAGGSQTYSFVKKRLGLNSNHYPDLPTQLNYLPMYVAGRWDRGVFATLPETRVANKLLVNRVGSTANPMMGVEPLTGSGRYHGLRADNETAEIGSNFSTGEWDPFIVYRALGGNQRSIKLLHTLGLPERDSDSGVADNSLVTIDDVARVRQKGSTQRLVTARQANGVPTFNADFIGQIYVHIGTRNAYVSVNTGQGAADWKQIT